ncbi:SDR family oxidoreductase, partial [Lentzea sp. PSKA42]|nr:SDR family oxidoreductase [Lentzea indica]
MLTSRRGLDAPGVRELVAELEEIGTPTTVVACDIARRDDVERMLDDLRADGREIRSVIHTAAVIGLHSIDESTVEGLREILAAKVDGATHLDELLTEDLDAFVLFSSISGMWGSGNHASYVAGNAYLNSLAANRRARGLKCTSISWGIWSDDIGLGRVDTEQIRRSGLEFMKARLALAGLQRAIEDDETEIAIANIAWDRYHPVFTAMRPTTLFEELPEVRALAVAAEQTSSNADGDFASKLRALPPAEREQQLLELVRAEAASVLGMASADALTEHRAFREAGFDSITAVDLRNKLAAATGLALPTTMVFDHPSPLALTEFLLGELLGADVPATAPVIAAAASDDPIAIIGMACRYPGGVATPEDLWNVVVNGVDAISGFPTDRGWDGDSLYNPDPDAPGGAYSVQGGFLHGVADFDPGFFGISPREALSMDPQQRLLLETAWESIERAGIDPQSLKGSLTGAFIGASYQDYSAGGSDQPGDEGHMITGTLSSVLSGRVSYLFGLEGPAVTLDTACSSSLVALHLACQSLRDGESTLALAGGVSVMATPGAFVGFCRQRALAKDGRCKAYSDAADGMTLAEGVGLVLLERLSDAVRNGHRILAVVRGSAVNQDGASNGLTAPNGPSQQRVIRQALANARLEPSEVDAVDGHGTGTTLGDPIEAQALLATYGQNRSEPLLLGSMKSNIGHTQMASGVASIIKMVLALRAGVLPRTLHVDQPSTKVDWSSGSIKLLATEEIWPETGRPRRAGVSSFGLSGTNAHVVLEAAPESVDNPSPVGNSAVPVLLSARADEALKQVAGRLLEVDADLVDLAASLATKRSTFERRAVVVASDRDELVRGLTALRDDQPDASVTRGQTTRGRTAFLFTGQGSQRLGMGRDLYRRYPVFADALDAVYGHLDADLDRPLRDVMWGEDAEALNQTGYAQPAIFAVEVALYRLVESWGVTPDYLAGHSIGEIAAAHVAGVLSLDDACTLISARARLMQTLPTGGAMVAIQATEDEITPHLTDGVSLAAVNGPASVVVAGVEQEVRRIVERFNERKSKQLAVSHAFHSPLMEPMLDDFRAVVDGISFNNPTIPLVTRGIVRQSDHWVRHVRETVRFADAVTQLEGKGVRAFLEIGPDGVLTGMAQESLTEEAVLVPALRRDRDEVVTLLTALAGIHVRGTTVDWAAYFAGTNATVELPTYPFQHQRFWPEPVTADGKDGDFVDDDFWAAVEREDFAALTKWRSRKQQSTVDSWRYAVTWKPITTSAALTGPWLVLTDHDASELIDALGVDTMVVDPASTRAELAEQVRGDYAGVLSLLAINAGVEDALVRTSVVVQALGDAGVDAPLWVATQGAVSVGGGEQIANPGLAAVHGLGRVIALEHPQRWGGLIDLPATLDWNTAR